MNRQINILARLLALALAALAAGETAAQSYSYTSDDDTIRINGGVGVMYLEGNEKVVNGDYTVSHLIWQSTAPVLRGSVAFDVGQGVSISAEGSVAAGGIGYMEDYDWLKGDDTFDNWSHRSQHPDTRLEYYFTGSAALGYELVKDDTATVRVHGGFKYSDVQWTAYGGTYLYSTDAGFRDNPGSIPQGTPGITYRQQFPELFVGFDGEEQYGDIRVGGLLRGGVTFLSQATDDHWLRNLRFTDTLKIAPTLTVGADVGFALSANAEITFAARYEHVFEQRGDVVEYNTSTGATRYFSDQGSGGLRSAEVTAGLRGAF